MAYIEDVHICRETNLVTLGEIDSFKLGQFSQTFPDPKPTTWVQAGMFARELDTDKESSEYPLEELVLGSWYRAWQSQAWLRVTDLAERNVIPSSGIQGDPIQALRSHRVRRWVKLYGSEEDIAWVASFYGSRPRRHRPDRSTVSGPVCYSEPLRTVVEWSVAGVVGQSASAICMEIWRRRPGMSSGSGEVLEISDKQVAEYARSKLATFLPDASLTLNRCERRLQQTRLRGRWIEETLWKMDFEDSAIAYSVEFVARPGHPHPICVSTARHTLESIR